MRLLVSILAIGIPTFSKRALERKGIITGDVRKTALLLVTKVYLLGSISIPKSSWSHCVILRSCPRECESEVENCHCLVDALSKVYGLAMERILRNLVTKNPPVC